VNTCSIWPFPARPSPLLLKLSTVRAVSVPPSSVLSNLGLSLQTSLSPSGQNPTTSAASAGSLFFPQSRSLGLDRGEASCSVLAKITYAGVMSGTSFRQGGLSLAKLAELKVSPKQVERVVHRTGEERIQQFAS
jgi:hypothetical protein